MFVYCWLSSVNQEHIHFGSGDYIKLSNNKRIHQVAPRGQYYVYDSVLFLINDMAVRSVNKTAADWLDHMRTNYVAFLRESIKTQQIKVAERRINYQVEKALPSRTHLIYVDTYLYENCWEPANRMYIMHLFVC